MGTAGSSVVIVRRFEIFVLVRLTQHVQQLRHGDRHGGVDRFLKDQQQPGSTCQVAFGSVPQSVIPTAVKTSRQDVLQEPPQELDTGNSFGPPGLVVAVLPAEGHVGVVHGENSSIADRGPKDRINPDS